MPVKETTVEIKLNNLKNNLDYLKSKITRQTKFMAVVKNGHSVRIQTNDTVEEGFRPRFCVRLNFFVVARSRAKGI